MKTLITIIFTLITLNLMAQPGQDWEKVLEESKVFLSTKLELAELTPEYIHLQCKSKGINIIHYLNEGKCVSTSIYLYKCNIKGYCKVLKSMGYIYNINYRCFLKGGLVAYLSWDKSSQGWYISLYQVFDIMYLK